MGNGWIEDFFIIIILFLFLFYFFTNSGLSPVEKFYNIASWEISMKF